MHRNWLVSFAFALTVAARAAPDPAEQARAMMTSGLAHERLGQNQDAVVEFTQALRLHALSKPDTARAYYDRGVALDALGQTHDAIEDYSEAIRIAPEFAPALNNRGNAFRRMGEFKAARRDYLAALDKSAQSHEYPYFGLGQISEKLGNIESARDYYTKALAANPHFALAAQSLAGLGSPPAVAAATAEPEAPAHAVPPPREAPPLPQPALRPVAHDPGQSPHSADALVQLGAFESEAAATQHLKRIMTKAGALLDGRAPFVVPADLPNKGRFYRLRVGAASTADARKLCSALSAKGVACFLARD